MYFEIISISLCFQKKTFFVCVRKQKTLFLGFQFLRKFGLWAQVCRPRKIKHMAKTLARWLKLGCGVSRVIVRALLDSRLAPLNSCFLTISCGLIHHFPSIGACLQKLFGPHLPSYFQDFGSFASKSKHEQVSFHGCRFMHDQDINPNVLNSHFFGSAMAQCFIRGSGTGNAAEKIFRANDTPNDFETGIARSGTARKSDYSACSFANFSFNKKTRSCCSDCGIAKKNQ